MPLMFWSNFRRAVEEKPQKARESDSLTGTCGCRFSGDPLCFPLSGLNNHLSPSRGLENVNICVAAVIAKAEAPLR